MPNPDTQKILAAMNRIFDECENNRIVHGHTWGKWRLDATNLTLNPIGTNSGWYVDLETIRDSGAMLDFIMQLQRKQWSDAELVRDLIKAMDDLFSPQDNLCGIGNNRSFDPKSHFRELLG